MKYVYIVLLAASALLGGYIGAKFFPRSVIRTVSVPVTTVKEVVKTKEVIKQADGTVIERVVTQTKDSAKVSPQPKVPQYRAGVLIETDHKPDLGGMKISVGRRLLGDVWVDAQYDFKHKEATLGLSYEF